MNKVESTLSRLDGVTEVSAGWRTDQATIVAAEGARIDEAVLNEALAPDGFQVTRLERIR